MFNHIPEEDSKPHGSAVKSFSSNEVVWFGRCGEDEHDASGMCSPPLWKTSNPHGQNRTKYSQLSAAEKAQAVARGQQELMEMIKNMPESSYELSLKDLVEHNHHQRTEIQKPYKSLEEDRPNGDNIKANYLSQFTKEVFSKKKTDGMMKRSGSLDNGGFLIKMFLPFDFRLKGAKRVALNESKVAVSKISPRSSSVRSWDGLSWFGENESIRTSTSRSDSKRLGTYRSSSGTNSKNKGQQPSGIFLTGCWSVLSFKKKLLG